MTAAAGGAAHELQAALPAGWRLRDRTEADLDFLRTLYAHTREDELVFVQMFARNDMRAPLADIVSVTTKRSHLGKTVARKLLTIEWKTAAGDDEVAFFVSDLDAWLAELAKVAPGAAGAKDAGV